MTPPTFTRSDTRFSFFTNMTYIGIVCVILAFLPPFPVSIQQVLTFAFGYSVALCACGLLLTIRDAWFRYDENVLLELVDRRWSLVQCSNGQWSVLDHKQRELSMDQDWKLAIHLALMQESTINPHDI